MSGPPQTAKGAFLKCGSSFVNCHNLKTLIWEVRWAAVTEDQLGHQVGGGPGPGPGLRQEPRGDGRASGQGWGSQGGAGAWHRCREPCPGRGFPHGPGLGPTCAVFEQECLIGTTLPEPEDYTDAECQSRVEPCRETEGKVDLIRQKTFLKL